MTLQKNQTQQFYDRISKAYDLLADGGEHKARERGLEVFDAATGERILEIGFGTGRSLEVITDAVGDNGHVSGIDISEGMLDVATKRLTKASLQERATLVCGQAPPLPYPDEAFDAAFMSFTLELFPLEQIPKVLAETARVLRPGGRLGIVSMATVMENEHESPLEKSYKWMHQHFPHIVDCQPIAAEHYLEEAGFELAHQERVSLFTMPVAVLVGKKSR